MKQLYFLFLSFFFTTVVVHGQTTVYHPFPDSNAVWRWGCTGLGQNCCCSCSGVCLTRTDYQDSLGGDSTIGAFTYKKIWSASVTTDYYTGQISCAPGGTPKTIYHSSPYKLLCLIRQSIAQKKIYFYDSPRSKDTLLYDFNLSIGDTLPASAIYHSQNYYVSKVDSISIGGNYHKRFWLWFKLNPPPASSDSGRVAYIEGIGSTDGLFAPIYEPFENFCGLNCVQVNASTVYVKGSFNCAPLNLTLSANEQDKNSFRLTISPNPFSSHTTIQTASPPINGTLTISNCLGQTLKEIKHINENSFVVPRGNLARGLYFVQLMQDNQVVATEKIIIND